MQQHADDGIVQYFAIVALPKLTEYTATTIESVGAAGACAAVVAALHTHLCDCSIAEGARLTTVQLACASQALVQAMVTCCNDAGVPRSACNVVARIADYSSEHQAQLSEAGACKAVAAVLRQHKRDHACSVSACQATACLARGSSENIAKLGDAGACEALVKLLEQHSSYSDAIRAACQAICQLAATTDIKYRLCRANARNAVQIAQTRNAYDKGIVRIAQRALDALN
jgi:Armadillo/beta-catenin-like repeat